MWTISAAATGATGAANVLTNLRRSDLTGAEVSGDALRCGHGWWRGAPLLQHICWPVGTGSGLAVYTSGHLFAKRWRNRRAQRSFL